MYYITTLVFLFILIMAELSFATINTRGCRDSFKRFRLFNQLRSEINADIAFVQDTHTSISDEPIWRLIWRGEMVFSHFSNSAAGVALLFKPKLNVHIINTFNVVPGRILHVTAKINDRFFLFD